MGQGHGPAAGQAAVDLLAGMLSTAPSLQSVAFAAGSGAAPSQLPQLAQLGAASKGSIFSGSRHGYHRDRCSGLPAFLLVAGSSRRLRRRLRRVIAGASSDKAGIVDTAITTINREDLPAVHEEEDNLELDFQERTKKAMMNLGKEHKHGITIWNDSNWDYFDLARIFVRGGAGGNGCKSFHSEAFMEWMGPDGGNGGNGGSIFLRCEKISNTLRHFNSSGGKVHWFAKRGGPGMGSWMDGKNGYDVYLSVPPGTVVHVRQVWTEGQPGSGSKLPGNTQLLRTEEISTRKVVGELTHVGQVLRVARGGKGGKGNFAFKSHSNTAPVIAMNGEPSLGRWLELELKIVADVGLIGVPNAGKSSLLNAVTNKDPKIAAYPFTTTMPNLGQFIYDVHGGLTLCDVPGLIDGAASGRGMGFSFLRHIERCRTLIHVVSGDSEDPLGDFDAIQQELQQYSTEVGTKPQVVVVNKCDLPEVQEKLPELMAALRKRCGHSRVFNISAATRLNADELMARVFKWHRSIVNKDLEAAQAAAGEEGRSANAAFEDAKHVIDSRSLTKLGLPLDEVNKGEQVELDKELPTGRRKRSQFQATVEWDVIEEAWRLCHPEIERAAQQTNWIYEGGVDRFTKMMKATGMSEALDAVGAKEGDTVIVGPKKFLFQPSRIGQDSRMLIYEMDLIPEMEEFGMDGRRL